MLQRLGKGKKVNFRKIRIIFRKNLSKGSEILRIPEFGALVSVLVVTIAFSVLSEKFLTEATAASILSTGAELGIMAIGVAFLMISGEFDLSVSSVFALCPLLLALLAENGLNPWFALLFALGIACLVGLFNGFLVVKTGVPSFIITLGMLMLLRGIVLAITEGFPVALGNSSLFREALAGRFLGDFRTSIIWLIFLCFIFTVVLLRTGYGNWTFAVGGNKETARAMGVKVTKVKLVNFMLCSLLAAFAGCVALARYGMVAPTTGTEMELEAIASAVMGGTLLTGGSGSIVGAFLGALLIAMMRTGLVQVGAPPYWYRAFIGVILIAAAVIHLMIRKRTR